MNFIIYEFSYFSISGNTVPSYFVNQLMYGILRVENVLFPYIRNLMGSSIVVIAQKKSS